MPKGQFPAVFSLADLNGKTGFKLEGESSGSATGYSVSEAGDINGDCINDLLIGAQGYNSQIGRSYVIFGGREIGSSGLLQLSALNGTTGFKLDGESYSSSGFSVSGTGDINGDGFADLLIGAPYYNNYVGRSYIVFGGIGIGSSGVVALSALNGINGFKLDGERISQSGFSVSGAGDINGDGFADLLIGAPVYHDNNNYGRSYVIFGGMGVGSSGLIALSALNGINGFKLDDDEEGYGSSGYSVSGAGDINGDGIADLLIGAPYYNNHVGRSYIVFGGIGIGSSGVVAFSALNGINGFKLDGEGSSQSGYSVSGAGDINEDGIADLLIGAPYYNNSVGRSYIVFGGIGIGSSGVLALSALNGINGFKLDGEGSSQSGYSVSGAGDINEDGIADLLIGSPYYNIWAGRSYIIFGGPGCGGSGLLELSILNGTNGFKLDGESSHDYSGCSVSGVGDINGDGIDDLLIGAPGASNFSQSYVVFGDIPPVLVNNSLSLYQGGEITVDSHLLAACDQNHNNETLVFVPSGEPHGYFESISSPGQAITNFTQQQVWNSEIRFVHDGSAQPPRYNISVQSDGLGYVPPDPVNITFLALANNQLIINQGQTVIINSANLQAVDENGANGALEFLISGVRAGQFAWRSFPAQAIDHFTQQNITGQQVIFIHDNSLTAPNYNVRVSSEGLLSPSPQPATIQFDLTPILENNQLMLNQGQTLTLSADNLLATHNNSASPTLSFIISNCQHGYFELTTAIGRAVSIFQQQNITDNRVQFVHDNGLAAPSYAVAVSDGQAASVPELASIDFDVTPLLEVNQLVINQGQIIGLTADNLYALHAGSAEGNLTFLISALQHGQFMLGMSAGQVVTAFSQQNVTNGQVSFVQDGSADAPNYWVAVSDARAVSVPQSASIDFDPIPVLTENQLVINQGQSLLFTADNLQAIHAGNPDGDLSFIIGDCQQGHFALAGLPVTVFQQQNITDSAVWFVHDNSSTAPGYTVIVSDGRTASLAQPAMVDFDLLPILENNRLLVARGQNVTLSAQNLLATHDGSPSGALSFLISDCQQGQFEWIAAPGQSIVNFQQQNISDGLVQFVHDNSQNAPAYQIVVSDGRASSYSVAGQTMLVLNNDWPVNQGEILSVTEDDFYLISPGLNDNEIQFNVSSIQHAHFESRQNPGVAVSYFNQQAIDASNIMLVPDDSGDLPACALVVSTQGAVYGSVVADIDYDTPPRLVHNQLKTAPGDIQVINSLSLLAEDDEQAAGNLQFTIQNVVHGYFAYVNNDNQSVSHFLQESISTSQIIFVTDQSGQMPAYEVSVSDGRMICAGCPQAAQVSFDGPQPLESASWIEKAIISASISGGIGFLLFLMKLYVEYKLVPNYFEKYRGQGASADERFYRQEVILPIATHIYSRVKVSSLLGYIGQQKINEYVDVVSVIVQKLRDLQVDISLPDMDAAERTRLLESITTQTQRILVGEKSCCSLKTIKNYFLPETSPTLIRAHAQAIADAVKEELSKAPERQPSLAIGSSLFSRRSGSIPLRSGFARESSGDLKNFLLVNAS